MVKSGKKPPTSFDLYDKLIKYTMILADIAGANMIIPNYKLNVRTYLVIIIVNFFTFAYVYGCFSGTVLKELLEGLTTITVGVQGMTKLYALLSNQLTVKTLHDEMRFLHETSIGDPRSHKPLLECVQRCLICYKIFMVSYFGVIICYELLPLLMYYYTGERILIIPVRIPETKPDTTLGYVINMFFQLWYMTYGGTGSLAADMLFLILVMHTTVLVSHFENSFDDLNAILNDADSRDDVAKIRNQLQEVWRHHVGIINYIKGLDRIYSLNSLYVLFTCALVLTLSLFLVMWVQWGVGPFISIAAIFQLQEYCILGTIVEIQNDKINTIIYGSLWYKLPVKEQKFILMMLMRAQNPPQIKIGRFGQLNVMASMAVLKGVYSYLMMIREFLG